MPLRKTKKTSAEVIRKAYKFLAILTEEQKVMFAQTFGCVRFLYNRMLDDKSKVYKCYGEILISDTAFQIFFNKGAKYQNFFAF